MFTNFRFYVEAGVEDGTECNSRILREQGWTGIMFDSGYSNPSINLY